MKYLRIGLIVRPHGVQGAVKALPLTDDNQRFIGLESAYLEEGGSYRPVAVSEVSVQPDAVHLKLSDCNSREDAEKLRQVYLCVDRAHAVKLPEGRYFVAELVGCEVFSSTGTRLGVLSDVLETGSADVYVIRGERQLMVPALKKLLSDVDIESRRIVLDADVLEEVGLFED